MKYFTRSEDTICLRENGHVSYEMLNESNGCQYGFCAGISEYYELEYLKPGIHEDQEGFYVIEGNGWAKIGEDEIVLEPGMFFLVPANKEHSIKRVSNVALVRVCWFHDGKR